MTSRNYERMRVRTGWALLRSLPEKSERAAMTEVARACEAIVAAERSRRGGELLPDSELLAVVCRIRVAMTTPRGSAERREAIAACERLAARRIGYRDYIERRIVRLREEENED